MHLIYLNRIVKLTVQSGLVCAALGTFGVAQAYIDERPVAPIKSSTLPLVMKTDSDSNANTIAPDPKITSKIGISGDFTHKKWKDVSSVKGGEVALAEALILLHHPVINQVVQLNVEPYLLDKRIKLKSGLSRQAQLEDIAKQLGGHIHFGGSVVTFNMIEPIVAAGGATVQREHRSVPNQTYRAQLNDKELPTAKGSVTALPPSEVTEGAQTPAIKTVEVTPPPAPKPRAPAFSLQANQMLSNLAEHYANKTHLNIIWDADIDYKIAVGFDVDEGDAVKNIQTVLNLYKGGPRPLISTFYERQSLLVIQSTLY